MLHKALKLYFNLDNDRASGAEALAAPPRPPPPPPPTQQQKEEASDFAYRHRLSQQAALMIFSKEIIDELQKRAGAIASTGTSIQNTTENPEILASGVDEPLLASTPNNAPAITEDLFRRKLQYKNFSTARIGRGLGDAGHYSITGKLTKDPSMNAFFNRLPAQILSLLVPKIELYKIFYPKTNSFSSGIPWRIPFDDVPISYDGATSKFVSNALEELLAGTSKGHGVGIKSFNYSFKGTNYAEIKSSISSELEIFFQTPEDIVKDIEVNIPNKNISDKFSYSDLYNQTSRYNTDLKGINAELIPNEKYYRIKAVIGYSPIDNNLLYEIIGNAKIPEIVSNKETIKGYANKILKAVEKSKVILFLSPYSHDIEFNEDGSCNLKIRFNSANEISMYSQQADIFRISNKLKEFSIKEKELTDFLLIYEERKARPDQQPVDECDNTAQKALRIEQAKKYFAENGRFSFTEKELTDLQNIVFESRRELYNSLYKVLIGEEGLVGRKNGIYSVKLDSWIAGVDQWGYGADRNPQDVASQRAKAIKEYVDRGNPILEIRKISFKDESTLIPAISEIAPQISNQGGNSGPSNNNDATTQLAKEGSDQISQRLQTEQLENGRYSVNIKFVFLGDIIDAALECLSSIQPISEQPRIILGEIPVVLPTSISTSLGIPSDSRQIYINLADIPVSLELFHRFLIDRIVDKQLTKYSVFSFLQDIIGMLIRPSIDPKIFGLEGMPNNSIRFSVSNICLPCNTYAKNKNYTDPLFNKEVNINSFNPIVDDNIKDKLKNPINDITSVSSPVVNYMFIYCSSAFPKFFNGIEEKDIEAGVFHFRIGTDTGIVKSIKFSRSDVPYQREQLAAQEGLQKGISLKQVYNSSITLFGNNIYYVGDYIFIEPYFFGSRDKTIKIGDKLGLGGYYQIIRVNSNFSEGDYTTTLECTYQAGVRRKNDKIIVTPHNSPCSNT